MINPFIATGLDLQPRVLGGAVKTELLKHAQRRGLGQRPHPQEPDRRAQPASRTGGFWEINTASHVDFPQQSRLIELVDNHDGTLSIFATMIDHAGSGSRTAGNIADPLGLASLARELSANDPQERSVRQNRRCGRPQRRAARREPLA